MKIEIKKMLIENFKGIQQQVIEFDQKRTVIAGRNEAGKTTVADAFFWCLFGKDSQFRTKFDIIPLDRDNQPIHNLTTLVKLELIIDGALHTFKRILEENWVKKRGFDNQIELTGTTTSCYIDDVPESVGNYNAYVSGVINEEKFKLLTSTTYFNEQMSWQDRRRLLTSLIEEHSYEEVAEEKQFSAIRADIKALGFEKAKIKYANQKKELDKETEQIPARIDEASKNINREDSCNAEELKLRREEMKAQISTLKTKANDEYLSAGNAIRSQLTELNSEIDSAKSDTSAIDRLTAEKKALELSINSLTSEITAINQEIKSKSDSIDNLESERAKLRDKWIETKKSEYVPDSETCPTCGQPLPEDMKESARANFEVGKKSKLDSYTKQAGEKKEAVENLNKVIENKKALAEAKKVTLEETRAKLESVEINLATKRDNLNQTPDAAFLRMKEKKSELESQLRTLPTNQYAEEITALEAEIDAISSQISGYDNSERAKARVKELEEQLAKANDMIIEIEGKLDMLDKLNLKFIETVEGDLNKLFDKNIQVRLFEKQVNGGFRETCDVLVKSRKGSLVAYPSVNTAGQINASLQMINLISRHFNIFCPVFIDHAESVSELFEIDAQMIELKVMVTATELTIK